MSSLKPAATRVRSVFLSDLHLGTRECRADLLLDFLHRVHPEQLFLVGDIIDLQAMRRSFYWPQLHNNVLRTILGKAKHDTRIIYIPGNHDIDLREFTGLSFGNLEVHREYTHITATGQELLVLHGDEFDGVVRCSRWLAALGTGAYDLTVILNRYFNAARALLGLRYWSLAGYLKSKVGNAMQYVHGFEQAAAHLARRRGYGGVICGHIHRPQITELEGTMYCNIGDWVENCTALVEDDSGELKIWNWAAAGTEQPVPLAVAGLGRAA